TMVRIRPLGGAPALSVGGIGHVSRLGHQRLRPECDRLAWHPQFNSAAKVVTLVPQRSISRARRSCADQSPAARASDTATSARPAAMNSLRFTIMLASATATAMNAAGPTLATIGTM